MPAETTYSDPLILEKEISNFKQAESALVQAQMKLAQMLSSSPAVIYSFEAKGDHKPSFISDNLTEILGYERYEYLENPKFWEKCLHPEDSERVLKAMPRLWEEGRLTVEYRFRHKDGSYRWVNDDMKLVRDEHGEPREVVGSWSDIEERKDAEKALIYAQDRLDHIMSTSPSVVYSFTATEDRTPTYISRNVTDLLGYEPREYLDNRNFWLEKVHPDDLERITGYLPRLYKEGRISFDYRLQKKDKSYCWINDDLVLRKDENGEPLEVIGSWSDITAKTQVGEALVSAQNRLSHLISFTPAVIYSFNVGDENSATFVSENIKDLLGYKPKEYLEDRNFWVERLHPDDKDRVLNEFPKLWKAGMFDQEYRFRKKNGEYIWVSDQLRIIKDENDEPKEVVGAWTDINELKQREQALAEADHQKSVLLNEFNAILDAIDYGVTFLDPDQRARIINRAFRKMWGISDEFANSRPTMAEIINYNRHNGIYDIPESEFDDYIKFRIEEINKGDTPPYDRTLADGRIIRYRIIALPEGVRMITYFDITELKQREKEAKEAEAAIASAHARINHIVSSSPAVVYSFEATGDNNPTFISDNVRTLFGYEPSEYLNNRNFVPARIHPDDSANLERGFSRLFKEGHLVNEYRFRHKNGGYRWVSDELRLIYNEHGDPIEIVGSWSDIDDRKKAEEALNKQTKYIELLERIAVAANQASNIEEALKICLDEVCKLTGWPVGHVYMLSDGNENILVSTKLWHFDRPEQFIKFKEVTEKTSFSIGVGLPGRVLYSKKAEWIIDVTKDTNYQRAELVDDIGVKAAFCFPVLVGDKVVAVLEFYTPEMIEPDKQLLEVMANVGTQLGRVIERQQAAEALAIAKEKAEAANKAKTQFVSSISHEFRTPLNAVIGITEMLIEDVKADDIKTMDEPLARVHRAGKHLLSLINEFLDISKIEAGMVDLHIKPVNINELINDITATIKPMLDSNKNSLEIKNLTERETMHSDGKRITQILLNLLSNAAKFTENGKITLKLKSLNGNDTEFLIFDVIDTGTGIPVDKIGHVFDEYSEVKSKQTKYASTGLGLGISRKLARILGGDITVTSEPGKGSTFSAKLLAEMQGDEVQSHKLI